MRIDKAKTLLERLEEDKQIQNYIAQSDSRYILFNVQEPRSNFPNYSTDLDEKLTSIAMSYLSIGCSFAEKGNISESIVPLEKGAMILENIHSPIENRNDYSVYFNLTGALAYYAAKQYSKSFILLKNISVDTLISELLHNFLSKKYEDLDKILSSILLSDMYSDEVIASLNDEVEAKNRVYLIILSKSLASLLEFIYSGDDNWLGKAKEYLEDLLELLAIDAEPSLWWGIRLLLLIVDGFKENSLWRTIPPLLGQEDGIVKKYISTMAFQKNPVVELFHSQLISLPTVLNEKGAVVSLPTSAGKTRIAEIAILDCLVNGVGNKVLYLAPFRSLAFEVEDSLSKVLEPMGFEVSHLYGGSQFSKLDETIIKDSNIVIATPEKAKAILRSNSELKSMIKLVIIDEGHLIGPDERAILSEILIDELRIHLTKNQGKMILLSAVLPNSAEVASWITGDETLKVSSSWRPSSQRFGIMEYRDTNINIIWNGEINSFNRNFITPFEVKRPRSQYVFPQNKKQAVAAAALKLSTSGSVLIFVCRKIMALPQAKELLVAMGEGKEEHVWSCVDEWNTFKLSCEEAYGEASSIYQCAQYGVLCHHAGLSAEVRLSMEKLIRKGNPKIIVATSTLGQGVNIGVSTVIFSNVWYDGTNKISNNDFWNIAGRAGRSFVDREGKILYVIDANKSRWSIRRSRELAEEYFESRNQDEAISGLLYIVDFVYRVAKTAGLGFETLLEMIAENDYSNIEGVHVNGFADMFDLLDDTLLALNLEFQSYQEDDPSKWIDDYFRQSLAFIQQRHFDELEGEDIISFLKARNKGVLKMAGDPINWKGLVSSSIPLRSGIFIRNEISSVLEVLQKYLSSDKELVDLVEFTKQIEIFVSKLPSNKFGSNALADDKKESWITGQSISSLTGEEMEICKSYYGYKLPWAINAMARLLNTLDLEEEAKEFETLAVLVQIGVPSFFAAKIYLAGINSRIAATELSKILDPQQEELSIKRLRDYISSLELEKGISKNTLNWVSLLKKNTNNAIEHELPKIQDFYLKHSIDKDILVLNAKQYNGATFLCSPDYSFFIKVDVTKEFPFDKVSENFGVYFKFENDRWSIQLRNPYLSFTNID
ncbi:DEAD/DEAH box helicase [Peribacillus frigoritolerans]|uniref:DEAD/DEAH box helicase n=1 Tax=Peribacillus frigoritolerans TaxID=450367 RepID=UPI00207A8615|nr:DEAD/DEAH box helicase [Peribacillus frigoritolerans]USK62811.1 DEAD/DEAH box helicase [Peribacillus frigoritolerans]